MNVDSETVWRALASPHRRRMIELLREGPLSTGQLSKQFPDLSRFAVMQHLGVLEQAALVLARKEGRQRLNYLNPVPLREIYERWVTTLSSTAAETALHLRRYAETTHKESEKMDQSQFRLARIELEVRIQAPRERVFAALTSELGNWWPHRYKEGSEVYSEPHVGGKFGERFEDGGGALYGTFVYLDPPAKVSATGPSSLNKGLSSFVTDTLTDDGGGTLLRRETQLWGIVPEDMERTFKEGTRALFEQALKGYLEGAAA